MKHLAGAIMILLAVLGACKSITPETEENTDNHRNDMIWDIAPYSILMEVTDTEGHNLFEASTLGNWLEGPVVATFDGKTYNFPSEETPDTKDLIVEITGLSVNKIKMIEPTQYMTVLEFGELNGGDNLVADLTLSWPDGTSDVITINHTVSHKDGRPSTKTAHFLNGEAVITPVKIVKSSLE